MSIEKAAHYTSQGDQICATCGRSRWYVVTMPHLPDSVFPYLKRIQKKNICDACLIHMVGQGVLLVATPEMFSAGGGENLTEEAQIIVTEDGTMVNEGTQFTWGE